MRGLILLFALPAGGDEVVRAAGGNVEELRAVLGLDAAQVRDLRARLARAGTDYESVRTAMREKGAAAALEAARAWEKGVRDSVRGILADPQKPRYDDWLAFKRRLAGEYDKALFGIPPVTEMKLRIGLGAEAVRKMQRASDDGLAKIQDRVLKMKDGRAEAEAIAKAVNDLRRTTIEAMIESVAGAERKKVKEYVKTWLQTAEAKLAKADRDRLVRVLKALAVADGEQEKRLRARLAAVFLHQQELADLRRGMAKELLMAVLKAKPEADIWEAIDEHGALIDVHVRRLSSLYEDVKADLPTKQVARLVSEGIIE
ncbi:MAG: hypothetical protein HYY17_12835 [Planctomycetes bacterium]|nr:hypothetical protein [Planctomycetota bacterium]